MVCGGAGVIMALGLRRICAYRLRQYAGWCVLGELGPHQSRAWVGAAE